jgi:gluconolactonase
MNINSTVRNWEKDTTPYPEPFVEVIDESFKRYVLGNAGMERLYTGCRWTEGPAWFGDGRYLLFSDIPNNRILRWTEETGIVSGYRDPSYNANGNARDNLGRLITCEHLTRRVTRTEFDGSITIIADSFGNSKLNAPNDVAIHKDGAIWFTDPGYGILNNYEGDRSEPELPTAVYRIDPSSGAVEVKATGLVRPNGLCFSPDFTYLYVSDSGSNNPNAIYIYQLSNSGDSLGEGKTFTETGEDSTDGMRCDTDGNLWASAQRGTNSIAIYNDSSDLIGRIYLPEVPSNLTFGGHKRNRLFITASRSIYSIYTDATGASLS